MQHVQSESRPAFMASDVCLAYPASRASLAFDAVQGVSLSVPAGGSLAVMGESGSGKSTLLRFLAGRADVAAAKRARIELRGGAASALGTELARAKRKELAELRFRIGYLGQDDGAQLTPEHSVGEILLAPAYEREKRPDTERIGEWVAHMFDALGMSLALLDAYPHELSKGQRQRVAVARALVLRPEALVLDEPTLGVDAVNRPRVVELLRSYRSVTGATLLTVTHDIGILESLVEQVLVMREGMPVGLDGINEIFRNVHDPYVEQLAQALRRTAYDEVY